MTFFRPKLLPASLLQGLMLMAFFGISSCKLEDNKLQAKIYPENGATNVPVNTVIEIQYPKELGLTDDQMKKGLFSIHECEVNSFDYLTPKQQTTQPATADPTKTTQETPEQEKTASNAPGTSESSNANTQFKAQVDFFHMHRADSTQTVFNYLVINSDQASPLKPATTYCVKTAKIKNAQGETVGPKEISFTTEESPSMTFDTKINPEIFGNRLAPTFQDENKQWQRDYIMVLFRGQSVNPTKIKSSIKLCLASEQAIASTDACKEFGKEIASDIFLVEGLQNEDTNMYAYYNLYAVTPRIQLSAKQQVKIVVNLDMDKEAEANVGAAEQIFDVDEESSLDWRNQYNNEIKGENNRSIASPNHRFFYVGSGS